MTSHAAHKPSGGAHRRSVALFGGTFDPVHAGHITVAQAAQRRFHLDAIYFIPSARPPHKSQRELIPFVHRYTMVALACADHPGFVPSLAEAPTPGYASHVFYTIDTVRRFHREHPDDHLFFILGADQFLEIPTWKNYESLLDACDFIIASRPGFRLDALRLVIPPEKFGRSLAPDPHKIVLRKVRDPSVDHGREPRVFHRGSRAARTEAKHPRACARARGGIHSRAGPVPVTLETLRPEIRWAVEAAQEKQAVDITVLKLSGAFAEYFLLCSGQSTPQLQAISDAVEERLGRQGVRLAHREGKIGAEWVLLDYGGFVVHIFSDRARQYYDLERLWRTAERVDFPASERPAKPQGESEGGTTEA